MKKINEHIVDWDSVAKGFGLSVKDTIEAFNDGRMLGRIGEYVHKRSENGIRQNENSSFDVKESDGTKSEIRSITDSVSFASSKEVGFGRNVTEEGFNKKLNSLDRYVLIDKRQIVDGKLSFIEVTKEDIISLNLGKNKSMSANKFFKIYDRTQ